MEWEECRPGAFAVFLWQWSRKLHWFHTHQYLPQGFLGSLQEEPAHSIADPPPYLPVDMKGFLTYAFFVLCQTETHPWVLFKNCNKHGWTRTQVYIKKKAITKVKKVCPSTQPELRLPQIS
ncbi:hypothetical protein ILYODFUR_001788 [Ilyodon furcidens]|uniref:Uncharacterized protein n=1 Tax=Ilyodon furcidens TaxID=33524 RepID=A0ABV0TF97_9TELE